MKNFQDYFEIIKFATPETNVRLKSTDIIPKSGDIISMRCLSWEDIMHLFSADAILTRNDIYCKWYVPYKPFARQDRTTDLRHSCETVILNNLLNGSHFTGRFIFLDVHSKAAETGKCIHQGAPIFFYEPFKGEFHHIVPDKGAVSKIFRESNEVTYCEKKRDSITGKLSGFEVPDIETSKKELVLIDDICDGGGTFIGIAEHLQRYRKNHKLILYVTHGLFTKGIDELLKHFDKIVTTNSVCDISPVSGKFEVLDVLSDKFLEFALR